MRNKALIEADSRFTPQILDAFQHVKINGKIVFIEVAEATHDTSQPKRGGIRYRKGRKFKAAWGAALKAEKLPKHFEMKSCEGLTTVEHFQRVLSENHQLGLPTGASPILQRIIKPH